MATDTAAAPAAAVHDGDAHGAHHGHHPPHLQHHFVSSEQQFDSAKLGMWIFLITEILLFSGMFVAYTVYRVWHPEAFSVASATLDWRMGGLNTLVLLASSLTVALSIHYAQKDNKKMLVTNLLVTLGLACVFLVVKYFEYSAKFEHGIALGNLFMPENNALMNLESTAEHPLKAPYDSLVGVPYVPQFFGIYFVMTGIHGFHVLVGMGVFAWLAVKAIRGRYNSEYYTPVELGGLYWHLVDIIWIFLFPLLYLV
jgi:cytochrome c oxidase subunit 3